MKGPVVWLPLRHDCVLFRTQPVLSAARLTRGSAIMITAKTQIDVSSVLNHDICLDI